jgi:hypothetical protein
MGRGRPLTAQQQAKAEAFKQCGKSNREIACLLAKSANAINVSFGQEA